MLHALLIYGDPADAPDDASPEGQRQFQHWMSYTQELAESGALKGGEALEPTQTATTVRVRAGETLLTDGPFAETKEVLGGFYLVEAPDLDAALALAARIPAVRMGGSVEVRPVTVFE